MKPDKRILQSLQDPLPFGHIRLRSATAVVVNKGNLSLFNRRIDNRLDSVVIGAGLSAQAADRFAQDDRHHAKRG